MSLHLRAAQALLLTAVDELVRCDHPALRVAGDTCTVCGSVHLRGSGWARPALVQAMAELVEASRAETLTPPPPSSEVCVSNIEVDLHGMQVYQDGPFTVYDFAAPEEVGK